MSECPFCGSQVSEDLVTYGGTCPKCFAEIPGEEAATDPGVEVKAALDRRDRRKATLRMVASLSAMLFVVGCTGFAAMVTLLWPEPQVAAILDFDVLEFPIPDIAGAEGDTQDGSEGSTAAAPKPGSTPKIGAGASAGSLQDDRVASIEPARPRPDVGLISPERAIVVPRPGAPSGAARLSIDMPTVRRDDNVVLTDEAAIRDMIGERLVEFVPGLSICYERRIKVSPSLKGRWRLKLSVLPSGMVDAVSVEALERSDGELERCVVEHIRERWRFGRINVTQPVSRTLRFYPQ